MSTETPVDGTVDMINGRIPRGSFSSLDSRVIVENLDLVLSHLQSRRASDETLDAARSIAARNEERVSLIQARDSALQTRNEKSAVVGKLMRNPDHDQSEVEEAKKLSSYAAAQAAAAEEKLAALETEVNNLLSSIPNLLDDLVPDGNDDQDNAEVESWGDKQDLPKKLGWPTDGSFEPKWHDDVAMGLKGWQAENAVAISGARFVALSGHVARFRLFSWICTSTKTVTRRFPSPMSSEDQHWKEHLSFPSLRRICFVLQRKVISATEKMPSLYQLLKYLLQTCIEIQSWKNLIYQYPMWHLLPVSALKLEVMGVIQED
jgi:hypothetical protein